MTKPFEETWRAIGGTLEGALVPPHEGGFPTFAEVGGEPDNPYGRARLAAQAPAMARLLLEIQWAPSESLPEGVRHFCPACAQRREEGHAADCELLGVLRAAGALP